MDIPFNNLYIHFVLTVKNRHPLISAQSRNRVEKYITGIVNNYKSKLYAIYANPEHLHILISKSPSISEKELITRIADASEEFINAERLIGKRLFGWQKTCSAFSVSKKDIGRVCRYIARQPLHHKKRTAEAELEILNAYYQRALRSL